MGKWECDWCAAEIQVVTDNPHGVVYWIDADDGWECALNPKTGEHESCD